MGKLSLDPEQLRVDTFEPLPPLLFRSGTVLARRADPSGDAMCPADSDGNPKTGCWNCPTLVTCPTEVELCTDACPTVPPTACEAVDTCAPSCLETCQPSACVPSAGR